MYTCPKCYSLPIKGDGFVIVCSVCNGTGGGDAYAIVKQFKDVVNGQHFKIEGKFCAYIKIPEFFIHGYEYNAVQYDRAKGKVTQFTFILAIKEVETIDARKVQ